MAATLVAIYAALAVLGSGDPRAARRQAATTAPAPAAQDAGGAGLPAPSAQSRPAPAAASDAVPASEAVPEVIPAASQTPEQVQRFPGPRLRPSPEHAGEAPAAEATTAPAGSGGGTVLYVTGNRVNMRAGPSTGEAVVGALNGGAAVEALGPTDGAWVNIRDGEGREGYISGQFLSPQQPG